MDNYLNKEKFLEEMLKDLDALEASCLKYADFADRPHSKHYSTGLSVLDEAHKKLVKAFRMKYECDYHHFFKAERFLTAYSFSDVIACNPSNEETAEKCFKSRIEKISRCKAIITNNGKISSNNTDVNEYFIVNFKIFVEACDFLMMYGNNFDRNMAKSYLNSVIISLCCNWRNGLTQDKLDDVEVVETPSSRIEEMGVNSLEDIQI